nr:hypothetical protein [uncultured Sphingorhabdus sp.]
MTAATAPRWITWVGIAFLLWNIVGIGAFISQASMSSADIAALPPVQRDLWASMPGWAWAAYAVAVSLSAIASVGLILRNWWAPLAYAISVIALLIQFSYPFLIAQGAQTGMDMLAFPMFIVVMGVLQWQLSRAWQRKGWLA